MGNSSDRESGKDIDDGDDDDDNEGGIGMGMGEEARIIAAAGGSKGTGLQAVPRAVGEGVVLPEHVTLPHGGPGGET